MKKKSFTLVEEIDDKELYKFLATLEDIVSEYVGFNVSFTVEETEEGGAVADAHVEFSVGVPTIVQNIGNEILERIAFIIDRSINKYKKLDINVLHNLPRDLSLSFIFDNYLNLSPWEQYNFIKTINDLRDIGLKTYENHPVDIGVVYCKDKKAMEEIESLDVDIITLSKKKTISQFFLEEKPLLKLIDNKSLAVIVDDNHIVSGIIRKKTGGKSLSYMFESKYNEWLINDFKNILFPLYGELIEAYNKKALETTSQDETEEDIEKYTEEMDLFIEKLRNITDIEKKKECPNYIYFSLENKVVNITTNQNFGITYSNGNWKLKHFNLMATSIMSLLFSNSIQKLRKTPIEECRMLIDNLEKGIANLLDIIKNISRNKNSSIFVIISKNAHSTSLSLTENDAKQILKKNKFEEHNLTRDFSSIIRKEENHINISDADHYLIETISAVDGAVVIDQYLNIVSFGEIISVPEEEVYSDTFGTGTKAARYASNMGIAIKISEDGDIYIFSGAKLLLKI